MLVPLLLWSVPAFQAFDRQDHFFQALYFGIAMVMTGFNLALFFTLRDPAWLYYVAFSSSSVGAIILRNGFMAEFFPDTPVHWSNLAVLPCFALCILVFVLMLRKMLETRSMTPRLDRLLQALLLLLPLLAVCLILDLPDFALPATLIYSASGVLVAITIVRCVVLKQRSARLFLAAFSALVLSALLTAAAVLGLEPVSLMSLHLVQIGSSLEMVLMAFALAERLRLLMKEKEQAQSQSLQAQRQLLDNLQETERLLEQRVQQRSAQLVQSNQALAQANQELSKAYQHNEALCQQARLAQQHSEALRMDLQQTQEQLIQAEKMAALGQLISQVAQEITPPINAIRHGSRALNLGLQNILLSLPRLVWRAASDQPARLLLQANHMVQHTGQINQAVERVSIIIQALKCFSRADVAGSALHQQLDGVLKSLEQGGTS